VSVSVIDTDGYLYNSHGRPGHHVFGLDVLARDALAAGVDVVWADLPPEQAAFCDCRHRRIVLALWLYWAWPWHLRAILCHELAHAWVGPSEERAHCWARRHYGDVDTIGEA